MIEKEYKIKVTKVIDDSQEKKHYSESEARRKKSKVQETEEERRKTALLKSQLNEQYANLKANLEKERIARQQNKEMVVKEAIRERKILEAELRNFNATHRVELSTRLAQTKAALDKEVALYKAQLRQMSSAPRTNLRGNIGSEAYVRQLQSARTTMLPTSPEFAQTTALINRYKDTLKQSGVEVKSLAQNIRGELSSALSGQMAVLIGTTGAWQLFNLSLQSAKFNVLMENFEGTTQDLENFRKATSGTVDDGALLRLSNQASDLGISLKDQTILFSLAEDAADKYGTTVEEGFQKVVFATEGNTKGLKMLGIQKAEYEEIVKRLALEQGKEIDQLDAETQKQIRLQAILIASGKSYEDVTNKVQDSADKHEQFIVIVKNLSLRFGGDLFNAVTGVGTAYVMLNKLLDDANKLGQMGVNVAGNLVSAWQNVAGEIPVLGDAISWLADRYRDLFGAQSQTAGRIFNDAGADFIEAFDPNSVTGETRKGGNANVFKKSKVGGTSRSQTTKEIEEQLNLIKKLEEDLAKAQTRLQSNLGDIGAERDIRAEILEIEKKIYYYRTGQVNDSPFKMRSPVDDLMEWQSGFKPKGVDRNPRWNNDANDLTPEEVARRQEETYGKILGYTDGMFNNFTGMLEATGLMSNDVQSFVSFIQNAVKFLNSSGGLVQDVIGFFGSVFGAPSTEGGTGSGGFMNPMSGGMPGSVMYRNSITVEAIPNEYLEYKITSKGNAEIARRGTGVY